MTRLTIENAKKYLVNMFAILNPKADKKATNAYNKKIEEMNKLDLRKKLEEVSLGDFTLKGIREATNISFAPKKTQAIYREVEAKLGALDIFIGKGGFEYECGVYCKKVLAKNQKHS